MRELVGLGIRIGFARISGLCGGFRGREVYDMAIVTDGRCTFSAGLVWSLSVRRQLHTSHEALIVQNAAAVLRILSNLIEYVLQTRWLFRVFRSGE